MKLKKEVKAWAVAILCIAGTTFEKDFFQGVLLLILAFYFGAVAEVEKEKREARKEQKERRI